MKKNVPEQCFAISPLKSWGTLLRLVICLMFVLFLETRTDSPLILPLIWFLHGQVLVGFFVLGHDCGHHTFSRSKIINQIVGIVTLAPLGNGYFTWQRTHNVHHAKTQLKGVDIDWSSWLLSREEAAGLTFRADPVRKLGYVLPFGIFTFVLWNALRRGFEKSSLKERLTNLSMWTSIFGLYVSLVHFFGWWGLFKFHVIPATIAMYTGYFLLIIQHANEETTWYSGESWEFYKAQFGSTFDVRFPRILEWLWLDINIHVPHHLFPQIPWYHLRAASRELKSRFSEKYRERRVSLKEVNWMFRTPYILEIKQGTEFRLIK